MTAPDAIAFAAMSIATMAVLTGPIGRAVAERLRGRRVSGEEPALAAEVEALRGRLAEVEERLDFAERLLAQATDPERLQR